MKASYYKNYVEHLASWGYVILQYDTPFWSIIDDETEVMKYEFDNLYFNKYFHLQ